MTTTALLLVPIEIFPVPGSIEFVHTIPVPMSPSGGQNKMPSSNSPLGSRSSAPSLVNLPAFSPANRTLGRRDFIFQPTVSLTNSLN